MKCPKCGYVSFEYLDECKKCGKSLQAFKSEHGFYGYQHKDLMVEEYLEEKSKTKEEAGIEGTEEEDAITNVGEEDGSLENIVSKITIFFNINSLNVNIYQIDFRSQPLQDCS